MKWWNDLWLNESFATFMSFVALDQAPEVAYFKTHWVTFLQYKFWGINDDVLPTTHPITCVINATDEAENLFDGISYGKGASFLKQLFNMIGGDVMSKGLGIYFSKHKWQNTELKDFIGAMHDAYLQYGGGALGPDFNLWEWSDTWLSSSGVNILEPVIEWNGDGTVKKLQIKQTNDLRGKNRLRKQKIDLAVYDEHFQPHVVRDILISEKDALNDVALHFDKPVTAIIINVNDHGYAKVRYDQKTLDAFVNNLQRIEDSVTRAQVWRQLWLLVMDRKMSSL
jgi:aminopeptidase N